MNKTNYKYHLLLKRFSLQVGIKYKYAPAAVALLKKRLKKFNENQLLKAIEVYKSDEWWQDKYPDVSLEFLLKTDKRIKHFLNKKNNTIDDHKISLVVDKFIRFYNWCVRNYYQRCAEYHPFIELDKENKYALKRIAQVILENKRIIKEKVNLELDYELKEWDYYLFIFILNPFLTSSFPPPLYYYYSDGLISDFKCDRVRRAFNLMREWLMYDWLKIDEKAIERKPNEFSNIYIEPYRSRKIVEFIKEFGDWRNE